MHEPVKQILELVVKVGPNLLGPRVGSVPNGHGFHGDIICPGGREHQQGGCHGIVEHRGFDANRKEFVTKMTNPSFP